MGYPDFPIPEQKKSYLTQAEILDFLNLYAENFGLKKYIKVFIKFFKGVSILETETDIKT